MADMTDAQVGGQKGRATTDHLLILKEAINAARTQKQPVYATFLDVTKAYDKAWIDAIMYVMNKRGINSQIWAIIKKLNENLTATIQTKFGPTRKIHIKDSIRQGGGGGVPVRAAICPAYGWNQQGNTRNQPRNQNPQHKHQGSMPPMDGRRPHPRNKSERKTNPTRHNQQNGRKIPYKIWKGKKPNNHHG